MHIFSKMAVMKKIYVLEITNCIFCKFCENTYMCRCWLCFKVLLSFLHPSLVCRDMVLFQPNSNINASKVLAMYRKEPFTIHALYANPECTPTGRAEIGSLSTLSGALLLELVCSCVGKRLVGCG